jgi:pectate lyase
MALLQTILAGCCALAVLFAADFSGLTVAAAERAPAPAFPGAEGFGAKAVGGRGGKVLAVTTLEDYNPKREAPIPGSLRWAVDAPGPRIVVFRVAGVIELKASLAVTEPHLTIAGQTAPGDGICLTNYTFAVRADEVIVRHLRFRLGDAAMKELDSLDVFSAKNVILDHCSASWSVDETLSVTGEGCRDVTVQWCFITESLDASAHHKGTHGYGSLIRADGGITFHHNLYAHHRTRCPRPGTYGQPPGLLLDFRNNVVYDWISPAGYTSKDPARLNYVGNYLKPGPSTRERVWMFSVGGAATQMFAADNMLDNPRVAGRQDWDLIEHAQPVNRLEKPFEAATVTTDSATTALARILESAGASLPQRDAVDRRIVDEVREGTGRVINSPADVGGLPKYASSEPPADGDQDGMPDAWEKAHGLDPANAQDGPGDADGDGYTNVEEFLNGTDPQRPEASSS